MKLRTIIVIDIEVDNHMEAVEAQDKALEILEASKLAYSNGLVWGGCRVHERRGDQHPDIDTMKLIQRHTA
jgi:hypothetical protein